MFFHLSTDKESAASLESRGAKRCRVIGGQQVAKLALKLAPRPEPVTVALLQFTIHNCPSPQRPAPSTWNLAPETCPSPVQFDHVFILEEVIAVDHLALEFPVPPDARILELGEKIMVNMCSQVEHARSAL